MGPHPAVAEIRNAVRRVLTSQQVPSQRLAPQQGDTPPKSLLEGQGRVWVACSGGADSLALAAATAFVARRLDRPAALVTVDHGLQRGSADQAARVCSLAHELGFDPVVGVRVEVGTAGGPEAA